MVASDLDRRLACLGDLAVATAVRLQRGQELVVSAPIEASVLVRHVVRAAYQHGARGVTCVYEDPAVIRERLSEAPAEALDSAPLWLSRGLVEAMQAGAARLRLLGPYPDLLAGVPAERILRAHRAHARAGRAEAQLISRAAVNGSALPVVTGAWARQVFPGCPEDEARRRLWETLFDLLRLSEPDPRRAWDAQIQAVNRRRDRLQACRFAALRLYDGRTDLTVGLAPDAEWSGGSVVAANGVECLWSLPSEEVWVPLDRRTASGRVHFSRPLALGGTVVRGLYAEFRDGVVTTVKAETGADVFQQLIAADDGRRLGEIGLVAGSSPVARSGIPFWHPLLDRNAASHLAFGKSLALTRCGRDADPEDGTAADGAALHVDCMFGHEAMQVDGVTRTGSTVPVMRAGEFVAPPAE